MERNGNDEWKLWEGMEREMVRKIVMGDMNANVGYDEIVEIVGKWGVPGVNENGLNLVDVCPGRGLFLANTFYQHKMIRRCT